MRPASYVELEVELTDTIEDVKFNLSNKKGIPGPWAYGLAFEGKLLRSGMVQDYAIQNGSVLNVLRPMYGG